MRPLFAFCLALAIVVPAAAQDVRTAIDGAQPAPATIADFAWMEGRWVGDGFGGALEEVYSAPSGGQMPGHFRMIAGGAPSFYEFVMLAEVDGSVEYRVRHFNPDMTAWEDRERFVRFPLIAAEDGIWYFDGLTIARTGPDSADHVIRVRSSESGEEREVTLSYRRAVP